VSALTSVLTGMRYAAADRTSTAIAPRYLPSERVESYDPHVEYDTDAQRVAMARTIGFGR
jgi:hypothetical protein